MTEAAKAVLDSPNPSISATKEGSMLSTRWARGQKEDKNIKHPQSSLKWRHWKAFGLFNIGKKQVGEQGLWKTQVMNTKDGSWELLSFISQYRSEGVSVLLKSDGVQWSKKETLLSLQCVSWCHGEARAWSIGWKMALVCCVAIRVLGISHKTEWEKGS